MQVSDGDFDKETTLRFKRQIDENDDMDDDDDAGGGGDDDDAQKMVTTTALEATTDACVVQFKDTEKIVQENSNVTLIDVVRTGNLLLTCSVLCYTEDDTTNNAPR